MKLEMRNRTAMATAPSSGAAGVLWVPRSVLRTLDEEAARMAPQETGGVLMGYWAHAPAADVAGLVEAVVTACTGPGPQAVHRRTSFSPDDGFDEREIARLYAASGRRAGYLGDWHSHPGGPGRLSGTDYATLRRIAREPNARAPHPVMVVLAGGEPWVPHAWFVTTARTWPWWQRAVDTPPFVLRPYDPAP